VVAIIKVKAFFLFTKLTENEETHMQCVQKPFVNSQY